MISAASAILFRIAQFRFVFCVLSTSLCTGALFEYCWCCGHAIKCVSGPSYCSRLRDTYMLLGARVTGLGEGATICASLLKRHNYGRVWLIFWF